MSYSSVLIGPFKLDDKAQLNCTKLLQEAGLKYHTQGGGDVLCVTNLPHSVVVGFVRIKWPNGIQSKKKQVPLSPEDLTRILIEIVNELRQ